MPFKSFTIYGIHYFQLIFCSKTWLIKDFQLSSPSYLNLRILVKSSDTYINRENEKSTKSYWRSGYSLNIYPEGTRGPIWPEVVVLEPWHSGQCASIKKFVDLTSSVFDIFSSVFKVFYRSHPSQGSF